MAKVRKGFVSNSSSSSFICDITGGTESGYDAGLSDFEMCSCENGHTFYTEGYPAVEKFLSGEGECTCGAVDEDDCECDFDGDRYELPAALCPICNGDPKAKKIIIKRLRAELKNLNVTIEELQNVQK